MFLSSYRRKFERTGKNCGHTPLSACVSSAFLILPNSHSCFYLTIRPAAHNGYGSIAHKAKPNGLLTRLIVLESPNQSDRKSNNTVSKCKLKKDLFGNKTKEFRYSMTIANSPLVAQPIKMQYLHQSTSWVILKINQCLAKTVRNVL